MNEVMTRPQEAQKQMVAPDQGDQLLSIITQAASNPQCDVEKLRALLDMKKQVMEIDDRKEFSEAMSAAMGEMPQIFKAGIKEMNGKGSYRFARWEDMDSAIRPVLLRHGLRLSFTTERTEGNYIRVIGRITHANGQFQESSMELPIDNGPGRTEVQARGSTISYGKRYCAEMLLNIVRTNEDNDGAYTPQKQEIKLITPEQKDELVGLLQKSGANTSAFLAYFHCKTLDGMPENAFGHAKTKLLQKINGSSK
ncbi:hypothetical protein FKW31_03115 [Acetobacter sp. DmW_136]|uniref:ERF family protein n=1 Tax=Acetobacter sp. DmW_136 TaxID=2591091 RepID=UPI00123AB677|nr:ERF family protein [Acetobacter sp. DmW_136]KAA8387649.1 hypothetical protein FKW31_03115 [Acetobacter sp. DmW_136]